ncbi:phenylalanine--tRNA ligase subunit alpha [Candidatus Wolfebacteria bacterium CG18_big_fil_WC_8_21_14_2_50_39_7]|uniref:Phenylalanine--tRNA ligase alpha subunit n=3 Tax=Candidatus Wolfeibacteriota TaxID=1752735 RepID=A0A2H0EBZ5_9BACT|nr:phenylalanine--tRNA ligase subunit alpha [Candidatus Wolfebacteria bacterium]PIP91942.1 MAG: phenylalanine--tRNA ligase subunit alpha [Candidatus Wolfebacteria bacterium CG18_big_fil_WC_8_21_14_2_50_39_7]
MTKNLQQIKSLALKDIETAKDLHNLEQIRIKYLGRKGELTQILRNLKNLSIDERRKLGPLAQKLKRELEEKIKQKSQGFSVYNPSFKVSPIDVSKPGRKISIGHLHPLTKIEEEVCQIFLSMNFSVVEGPEIEDEYHHFDALNIPKDHPARDAWNTFWLKEPKNLEFRMQNSELKSRNSKFLIRNSKLAKTGKFLLRAHTSPMQIRYMETHQPPFQIIVPGRVFRYEATDASHETTFTQVEGLMVGENISLANFKFIIEKFLKKLFGEKTEFELRPSYYPFTEPGVDVYMKWRGRWLEVAGSGMVHPKVFEAVGYNPYEWQGFAFGFGLNRLAMIKYNIPDIRLFYSGDLRFIQQF